MNTFKSLYNRRGRYGWLLLELILASAIAFMVLDPVVVNYYDSDRDFNLDFDRLVRVQLRAANPRSPQYDAERLQDPEAIETDWLLAVAQLATAPGVERAIPLSFRGFGASGGDTETIELPDSMAVTCFNSTFIPHTAFFSTLGFRAADIPGNPSTQQMDDMEVDYYNEAIVTRSLARFLYGDENRAMALSNKAHDEGTEEGIRAMRIVGIIEDTRPKGYFIEPVIRLYSDPPIHSVKYNSNSYIYNVMLRLKKGESPEKVAAHFESDPELQRLATAGVLTFYNAKPYAEVMGAESDISPINRFRNLLVIFFAANIFLGMFGTFWLLTRRRYEEAGIIRAFGATASGVRSMLYKEGIVLSTLGSFIGCSLITYYFYSHQQRLESGIVQAKQGSMYTPPELLTWVNDFWMHCGIIAASVITIMLIVTLLGIAIPAWRLSRIHPVDALRDE